MIKKMENYDLEKERMKHPYQYDGKVFEEVHFNVKFLIQSALQYVIDDYDEYLDSIEQSHYEDLNYYVVKNYTLLNETEVLDLTWMNKSDVFVFDSVFDRNPQHKFIKQINVNIDNLGFSHLPISEDMFSDIRLVVYNNESELNIIGQIKNFKSFVMEHSACLSGGIQLEGFHPFIEMILTQIAKNYGVEVSQEFHNKKSR